MTRFKCIIRQRYLSPIRLPKKFVTQTVLTSIFEKQGEKLTKANIIRTITLHNTEGENESDKDRFEFPERWRYNREVIQVSFMHFPEFSCAGEEGEDEEDGGGWRDELVLVERVEEGAAERRGDNQTGGQSGWSFWNCEVSQISKKEG